MRIVRVLWRISFSSFSFIQSRTHVSGWVLEVMLLSAAGLMTWPAFPVSSGSRERPAGRWCRAALDVRGSGAGPALTAVFPFAVRSARGRPGAQVSVPDCGGAGERRPQALDRDHLPVRQRLQRRPPRGAPAGRAAAGALLWLRVCRWVSSGSWFRTQCLGWAWSSDLLAGHLGSRGAAPQARS